MPGKVTRASAALLLLGALAYTAWVLEAVLRTGLDPVRTYVSELAAADQPLGGLFRAADLAAGLLVLAGALLGLRAARAPEGPAPGVPRWARTDPGPAARRPWLRAGWAALALFGAATAVDSRLPLSCAATADPACAARETAGLVPAAHTAHAVSSGLAMTGALLAMAALTLAARRHGLWPLLARTGPALVGLALAATAWTLAAVASFESGGGHAALGAAQRLQVLLVAVWIAVLAVSTGREAARTGEEAARTGEEAARTGEGVRP